VDFIPENEKEHVCMKKLYSLALEQKEDTKHGETCFPVQKYITCLKPDYPVVTTHWHDEAEFTLITDGSADYRINLSDHTADEGDLLFIPPRILHSVSTRKDENAVSETYVFHLNFLGGNSTDICSTRYLTPLMNEEFSVPCHIKPEHPAYASLRNIFGQLNSLYQGETAGYELALKALLLQVVFLLLQYSEKVPAPDTVTSQEKLKQALNYIEAHYAESVTVRELAGLCYFSEYHFMRFFKKHMNMTCIEYINNLRLEKAVGQFEQGNRSILDVSLASGFHNLSYFYKVFKRKYHVTPKEFIKILEENGSG